MLKSWTLILNDFLIDRTMELHDHLLPRDREYLRLQKEYSQATDELAARLGPGEYRLFLDYEKAATSLVNRSDELIYKQGLIDGLRLGNLIDRIRLK